MQATEGAQYAPDRVLVKFKAASLSRQVQQPLGIRASRKATPILMNINSRDVPQDSSTSSFLERQVPVAYEIVDGKSVEEKVEELNARDDVEIAEPDHKVEIYRTPSDKLFQSQWHHDIIESQNAWDVNTGTKRAKVCVIDSGSSINHPDLASNVIKGWNVVPRGTNGNYPAPGSIDWLNFNDTLGHGTHVTGLVGAVGNNGRGTTGVAWRVGILSCRFIGDDGAGYISDAITCMKLCRSEGAHVYSNSWGGVGYSDILFEEIKKIETVDGLFVVAAGNNNGLNLDSYPLYPASYNYDNVITVASTTKEDKISPFSNIGRNTVDLAAPGSSIFSTTFDGGYGTMSGTSMSTPLVAGAAALLKALALKTGYGVSAKELRSLLLENTDSFTDGTRYTTTGGRLNVRKAVNALKSRIPVSSDVTTQPNPSTVGIPQMPIEPEPAPTSADLNLNMCGTSIIRGRPAKQSSTYKSQTADQAVNGDCRNQARKHRNACAITGMFFQASHTL